MKVKVFDQAYDPWKQARKYQDDRLEVGKHGALALFIGTMRDVNEGDSITSMTLEHYPEMTLKHLEQITKEAMQNYDMLDVMLMHRVGQVFPSDPIVCVAVWSMHRAAAFDANRFVMEALKAKAPFWKKEVLAEEKDTKERWVEKNTPG